MPPAGRAIALFVLAIWLVFFPLTGKGTGSSPLGLSVEAATSTVAAGRTATYVVTITNPTDAARNVSLRHLLPEGFSYVPWSTEVRQNGALISRKEPAVVGNALTWEGLSVLPRRTGTHYGMHTFVQDRCDSGYIDMQLRKVYEVAGPGAYVKQLLYRINTETTGPKECWQYFVRRCYDLGLVPVVRLATDFDGTNWRRPEPYEGYAQAFKRVVAGLPRRDGHRLFVEILNEPNLNMEWGGAANGVEYGRFLVLAAAALRGLNDPRIVLLNGGLSPTGDVAGAVGGGIGVTAFIDQMATVPGALWAFDVWASHPYPGNRPPEQNLRDGTAIDFPYLTIDSYRLELDRLAHHGRTGLRVLITETGYRLGANDLLGPLGLPAITEANRADYIARAFRDYWSRWPEVIGVCPFFLMDPAGNASPWRDWVWMDNEASPRQQYRAVAALDKTPSNPPGEVTIRFRATVAGWAGTYRSSTVLTDGGGGSRQVSAAAPVKVTGAARPEGRLVCYEVLQNGGFEQDAAWGFPLTAAPAGYTSEHVRSGQRAGRIGLIAGSVAGTNWSSARQTVTLPANTVSATLSLWYYPQSRDIAQGRQFAWLINQHNQRIANAMWIASDARAWQRLRFDLLGYAGQNVTLHLGSYFRQGYDPIGMVVDDVSLRVCTVEAPVPTVLVPMPGTPAVRLPLVMREGALLSAAATPSPGDSPSLSQGDGMGEGDVIAAILAADLAAAETPPGVPRPTPTPRWLPTDDGSVGALALDVLRGRILAAAGSRLLVRDLEGRTLEEVTLPAGAGAMALDEAYGAAYLALPGAGAVVRYDGQEARIVAENLGRPLGLAVSSGHLFVGDATGRRLVMLDRQGHSIMRVADLEDMPGELAYDPLAHRIYVTQLGPGTLLAFDADTLEPLGQVALGGLGLPRALALDAEARRLYVAHNLSPKYGAVSVVDTEAWRVIAERTGTWTRPLTGISAIALDAARGRLMLGYSGGIAVLDMETLEVVEDAPLPPGASSQALTVDPLTGEAYLGGEGGGLWRAGPRLHAIQALP